MDTAASSPWNTSRLLFLDKPAGLTSFSAVARVRRALGIKKAGHTGTLDPMATGVLAILLEGATRFAEFLPSHEKAYRAEFRLGLTTDTLDITGEILSDKTPVTVSPADVERALAQFRGPIQQQPPMYSAVSKDGVRLYQLAHQGKTVEREARMVEIFSLELVESPQLADALSDYAIELRCSAGTYVRSLIDDLGRALGCGAVMTALRRTAAHGYGIERCVPLEQCSILNAQCSIPIDEALSAYPPVSVTGAQAVRWSNGGALDLLRLRELPAELPEAALLRVYGPEGAFLGLGRVRDGELAVGRRLL